MEERRQVGVGRLVAPLVAQRAGPEPIQRAEQVHLEAELLFGQAAHLAEAQAQFLLGGGAGGDDMHILADIQGNNKLALRRDVRQGRVWYNGRGPECTTNIAILHWL
ncbi:MAG: hypothetical protein ACLFVO_27975 [Chloroflexaceae bacterium]